MPHSTWRRWGVAAVAVAAAAPFALLAPEGDAKNSQPGMSLLESPDSLWLAFPNWVSDSGRIVGFGVDDGGVMHALSWQSAKSAMVFLPEVPQFPGAWAGAMNDRGQVAGCVGQWPDVQHAVIWSKTGAISDLHPDVPGYDTSVAYMINAQGDAAGYIDDTSYANPTRAVYWPANGTASVLPCDLSLYFWSQAVAINKDGTVCGFARYADTNRLHAAYWSPGADMVDMHDGVAEAFPLAIGSLAAKVLDSGEISGSAYWYDEEDNYVEAPWVWDPSEGTVRPLDSAGATQGTAWGGGGKRLVGYLDASWFYQGYGLPMRPAVWERGTSHGQTVWNLRVLSLPEDYVGFAPQSCNASGALVGAATADDGTVRAFYVPSTSVK